MTDLFRYAAFISYSSKDAAFASRLHGALERYHIPKALGVFDVIGDGKPNRIYPVFRDREELSAGDLGQRIEASLRASAALVVVCSPHAAASPWVQKEIEYFVSTGRRDRIFAILSDKAPLADETGADATALSFPIAFRSDALSDANALEPLAADARKGKDGFRNAWLKIVAGLVGVTPGQLIDRDKRRNTQRRMSIAAAAVVGLVSLAATISTIQADGWRAQMSNRAQTLVSGSNTAQAVPFALAGLPAAGDILGGGGHAADDALARTGALARIAAVTHATYLINVGATGRYVLANEKDESATVLTDVRKGQERLFANGQSGTEGGLSDDERHIFIGGEHALLVDLRTNAQTPVGYADQASFSRGGDYAVVHMSSWDGFLYNLRAGTHTQFTRALVPSGFGFSPDRRFLYYVSAPLGAQRDEVIQSLPQEVHVYEIATGADVKVGMTNPMGEPVYGFSSDSRYFLLGQTNPVVRDLKTGVQITLRGEVRSVRPGGHIAFMRDVTPPVVHVGDTLQSIPRDFVIPRGFGARLRDLETGREIKLGAVRAGSDALFSRTGRWFIFQSVDGDWTLYDLLGHVSRVLPEKKGRWRFSAHDRYLLSTDDRVLYDLTTGTKRSGIEIYGRAQFSPDGAYIVSVDQKDHGWVFDIAKKESLSLGALAPDTDSMAGNYFFTTDGRFLFLRGAAGVSAYELASGRIIALGAGGLIFPHGPPSTYVLLVNNDGGGAAILHDLGAAAPKTRGRALAGDVCKASGAAIWSLPRATRSGDDPQTSELYRQLRGRPWHPCDWRGLFALEGGGEGARQWLRLISVRYFGARDYACGEVDSSGRTSLARLRACKTERTVSARS